jgi:hypothetical protein
MPLEPVPHKGPDPPQSAEATEIEPTDDNTGAEARVDETGAEAQADDMGAEAQADDAEADDPSVEEPDSTADDE